MPFCLKITANNASLELFFTSLFELTLSIKILDFTLESGFLKGFRLDVSLKSDCNEQSW